MENYSYVDPAVMAFMVIPAFLVVALVLGVGWAWQRNTGRNFDIVTGVTAIAVSALLATGRAGCGLVLLWNVVGLGLLVNVVTVAILATPRFQYFGTERLNVFVTYPPFVWLPAVMVLSALAGHLVVFRALQLQRRSSATPHPAVR